MNKPKIIRVSTIPTSLNSFCKGLLGELSADYEVVALSSSGNELDEIASREGVRCIALDMHRRISPLKDLISLVRLIRVFREERPTMVHSITPKAGLLSMMAARATGVPLRVHTFTGLVFPTATGIKKRILMLTDRITCACATHIIPEGEGVRSDLITHKITKKTLRVLGYGNVRGVDMQYYSCTPEVKAASEALRRKFLLTTDDTVFLFVGRLVADKGIKELTDAFIRLHNEHPNVKLMLVGREEENIDPLDNTTKLLIEGCEAIYKVGEQSDVRPWYALADALVFPSYREGFPNVVLEAGAFDLPSIVTDINGSREIIIEGVNGTIVPPKNSEALYAAMLNLVQKPRIMQQMAANARKMVADRFEQSFVRGCLKKFYKDIIDKTKK